MAFNKKKLNPALKIYLFITLYQGLFESLYNGLMFRIILMSIESQIDFLVKMEMFLICLFAFNFFRFGQLFDLNDEEFLSDITFFNRSYAELRLLSSNKLINIWLKPYISNEGQNEEVIDKKCLFTGQVVIAHNIRGAVIISICGERIVRKNCLNEF